MISYNINTNLLDEFVNDFAEGKLTKAELESFSELQDNNPALKRKAYSGMLARKNVMQLPKTKCRPGFDQRMAAKFALELEREVKLLNSPAKLATESSQ